MKNEAAVAVPTVEITKQDAFLQQQQAGALDGRKPASEPRKKKRQPAE